MSHLFTYTEAAEYLGTSERHLRLLWQQRRIAAVKVGGKVRFSEAALAEYVRRHTVEAVG